MMILSATNVKTGNYNMPKGSQGKIYYTKLLFQHIMYEFIFLYVPIYDANY